MKTPFLSKLSRLWRYSVITITLAIVTACTTPNQLKNIEETMYFAGRLSLTEVSDSHNPAQQNTQSWTAHFELAGTPEHGKLMLYTPVGTTVAKVVWQNKQAFVEPSNGIEYFSGLDEISSTYFHQDIPITALFDWLQGKPTQQDIKGWEVDLTRADRGIIKAERLTPQPRVTLKAVVDEHTKQAM